MQNNSNQIALVLMVSVVSALLTSGIWLTAYFVGVKPNIVCKSSNDNVDTTSGDLYVNPGPSCKTSCKYELVESMPVGLYDGVNVLRFGTTADAWKKLMNMATETVEITAFYWSLLANDTGDRFKWDDSALTGQEVYEQLISVGKRGIKIRINQDISQAPSKYPYYESKHLADLGYAELHSLNFTKLVGGGVLHTKAWLVDGKHFYLGSANHDWRSLTQVKELGVAVYNCPCLAADLKKLFDVYAELGKPESVLPKQWDQKFATTFNSQNPMQLLMNDESLSVYFTSSPPQFVPTGREHDGDSLIRLIDEAQKFVYISVMDYAPVTLYQKPDNYYWPKIDDAIRNAAFGRHVHVRLLMSKWQSTRPQLFSFLHSLRALNSQLPCVGPYNATVHKVVCKPGTTGSIEIKLFEVPPYKVKVPYGRVNHAKYMVTEKSAAICTSNWSADYFITTGGISFIAHATDSSDTSKLITDMQKLHERDWTSSYATSIDEFTEDGERINKSS